jgi:regulator of protease activity HflC (stomatin/prohibitin superfamily)
MKPLIILIAAPIAVALIVLSLSIRVSTQYEKGVLFRLGKVGGRWTSQLVKHVTRLPGRPSLQ